MTGISDEVDGRHNVLQQTRIRSLKNFVLVSPITLHHESRKSKRISNPSDYFHTERPTRAL